MFAWLIGPIGRYVAGGLLLAALLGTGALKIRGCVNAERDAAALEKAQQKTEEVQKADEKAKQEIDRMDDAGLADFLRRGGVRQ